MHCLFGVVCAAASTILVVAIAKFRSYDKNRGGGGNSTRDSSKYYNRADNRAEISVITLTSQPWSILVILHQFPSVLGPIVFN